MNNWYKNASRDKGAKVQRKSQILKHTTVKVTVLLSFSFYVAAVKLQFLTFAFRHGLARSGTEYGPLTDLPDWSFAGMI